jgi:hypothetical protein
MRIPRTSFSAPLVAAALLLGTAASRAEDAKLEGAAAWQKLVGNTAVVTTKSGSSYTEFYDADGNLRRMDADGATKGQWAQDGDKVCFDYPDDDDRICLHVTTEGSSGIFTDPDGVTDTFQILPGNAKAL